MITLGIDIGSLTAKAVLLQDNKIIASHINNVKETTMKSAEDVVEAVLIKTNLHKSDIDMCCSTGYGREGISFSNINMSEISCHGLGAHWSNPKIRSIVDVGGQDCKVIAIDKEGKVKDFSMNEKCAAGTGRSLELLAATLGISLTELGNSSRNSIRNSNRKIEISNKCSIFMELDVIQHLYNKKPLRDISYSINHAVAARIYHMIKSLDLNTEICFTGGVSKNNGVKKITEKLSKMRFSNLKHDPQIIGALGAAIFAKRHLGNQSNKCIH
ncbi:MAG: 2-hydroxyglutaryl-CoA dehydratase [bacterium]|nr:2-hydroxyglutaryl-CoA dehydratase [bacterium]